MALRKKIFVPIAIIAAALLTAGAFCMYWSFHPNITITRVVVGSNLSDDEYYRERIMTIQTYPFNIPTAAPVIDHLRQLSDWVNRVETDLYENYVAPLRITVSGEVKDGKTTLWYEGYATTHNNETVEYREEQTFDYIFVPGDMLFK